MNPLIVPLFLVAGLVLGGASAPREALPFAFQLLSGIALAFGLLRARPGPQPVGLAMLCAGFAFGALVLLQLAPLPPRLWQELPGRDLVVDALALAKLEGAWLPVSLDPNATIASALAAMPAAALVVLALGSRELPIERAAMAIAGVALASWFLGALQFLTGRESALYLHSNAARGLAVGFFANSNHLATLYLVSVPIAAGLAARAVMQRRFATNYVLLAFAAGTGLIAIGITITGSVAGMALLLPAVIASLFLLPAGGKMRSFAIVASLFGILAALFLSVAVVGTSLEDGIGGRPTIWRNTVAGIAHFWPLGSGLGTFAEIYLVFEDPNAVTSRFVNHAHNDYLEIVLETGAIGVALIAGVLTWWTIRTVKVWRAPAEERLWQRAASIVIALVLAHSLVDYPLRTPALLLVSVFFAMVLSNNRPRGA